MDKNLEGMIENIITNVDNIKDLERQVSEVKNDMIIITGDFESISNSLSNEDLSKIKDIIIKDLNNTIKDYKKEILRDSKSVKDMLDYLEK